MPEAAAPTTLKALEPYENQKPKTVPVMEVFGPTIQGEGAMIGIKTMFIRFGGCDYRCEKCDSMHAVLPELVKKNGNWVLQEDLIEMVVKKAAETNTEWVTLSGGNPTMWDLRELVNGLQDNNLKVAVETQGSIWRDWLENVDQLTISPKGPGMGERFDPKIFQEFMERVSLAYMVRNGNFNYCTKIVVFDQRDLEFAVSVDQLLDKWGHHAKGRYLSLGNDCPPTIQNGQVNTDPLVSLRTKGREFTSLSSYLLWKYKMLLEDYLMDARLSHWIFLPQLHVLIWDNMAGV